MADSPQHEESRNAKAGAGNRGDRQHILYVDDDEPLVFLATCILERMGYRVTGSTDPIKALEVFRTAPQAFDGVISDLLMPGLTGVGFARELLKIRSDIPIIMTSSAVRAEDVLAIRNLGLTELVPKPATTEQFGELLKRLCPFSST